MKIKNLILITALTLLIACNPTAKLPGIKTQADSAFEQADYNKAHILYKQYIDMANKNNVNIEKQIYINQAQSCGQLDLIDEAGGLYSMLISDESNTYLIAEYAQLLQKNGKINDELSLWEDNNAKIKEEELKKLSTERIIALNMEKQNYKAVSDVYNKRGDITLSKEAQMANVTALENLDQKSSAASSCNKLLKQYPDYTEALEWKGKYYYDKAENKYRYEMDKYNKNKNTTTYAYLRRELKKVSSDFRTSRDVFLKLHDSFPKNETYIRYLKNIYIRLDNKSEAAAMDKLLK